jgi:DNA invertase Pin-like site-specific DNA recombinase
MSKPRCYSYLRFSRPEQKKGDSVRRQLENAAKYAKKNDLLLDENLTMRDEGLSAYKGDHIKRGALGEFLNAIRRGDVPKGSYLLVENFDRLSRGKIMQAFGLFTEIIEAGITIVTLMDEQVFNLETITEKPYMLYTTLGGFVRANDESKVKSARLSDAWEKKRREAHFKPMTGRVPLWLELDKTKGEIIPIPWKVKIVQQIYRDIVDGKGMYTIRRELNQKQIKPFGWGKSWHLSSIQKILKSRAVLGEIQLYKGYGKKQEKVGEPLKNYYPSIISDELFYQAQKALQSRALGIPGNGKMGKVKNLFTGKAFCAYCGGVMRHSAHPTRKKYSPYFVCWNSKAGHGCTGVSMRYQEFEDAVLRYTVELDIKKLTEPNTISELDQTSEALNTITNQLKIVVGRITNLTDAIAETNSSGARKPFLAKIDEYTKEQEILERKRERLLSTIQELSQRDNHTAHHKDQLKLLYENIENGNEDENIETRRLLRLHLAELIERIVCFPAGMRDKALVPSVSGKAIWEIITVPPDTERPNDIGYDGVPEGTKYKGKHRWRRPAYAAIWYKNGYFRFFRWDSEDWVYKVDLSFDREGLKAPGLESLKPQPGLKNFDTSIIKITDTKEGEGFKYRPKN